MMIVRSWRIRRPKFRPMVIDIVFTAPITPRPTVVIIVRSRRYRRPNLTDNRFVHGVFVAYHAHRVVLFIHSGNDVVVGIPGRRIRRPYGHPPTPPAPAPRVMPIVPHGSLGRIVRAYRSALMRIRRTADGSLSHGAPVWQRNYWDRVIRDHG